MWDNLPMTSNKKYSKKAQNKPSQKIVKQATREAIKRYGTILKRLAYE
jgi:hypothetical protein